ncbi:MAG: hypothetical protein ACM3X6_02125 [Patescibacteria group bacterium]
MKRRIAVLVGILVLAYVGAKLSPYYQADYEPRGASLDSRGRLQVGVAVWIKRHEPQALVLIYDTTGMRLTQKPLGRLAGDGFFYTPPGGKAIRITRESIHRYELPRITGLGIKGEPTDMATDRAGNLYVAGELHEGPGRFIYGRGGNLFLAKIAPGGKKLWCQPLGTRWHERDAVVAVDDRGNAYVAGYSMVLGLKSILLAKCDPDGRLIWLRQPCRVPVQLWLEPLVWVCLIAITLLGWRRWFREMPQLN